MKSNAEDRERVLADNLDRLVASGEPLERMPDDVRARIRARLDREAAQAIWWPLGRLFRPLARFPLRPAAASAVVLIVVAMILLWPRQHVSAVSWSAVAARFESVRSVIVYGTTEVTGPDGGTMCAGERAYFKDAGRMRLERYRASRRIFGLGSCEIAPVDFSPANLLSIMILSAPSGGERQMLELIPRSLSALLRPLHGVTTRTAPGVESVCRQLALVREGATTRLGDRTFAGISLAGFETSIEAFDSTLRDGFIRVWVEPATAIPRRVELVFNRMVRPGGSDLEMKYRSTMFRFDWNADFSDDLLELRVPEGWPPARRSTGPVAPPNR